jgi:biotin carboxyl carrier protein
LQDLAIKFKNGT